MIDTSYGGLVFHPLYTLTGDEIAFVSRKANPPVPNHPDS
jgi:hypothetical protein